MTSRARSTLETRYEHVFTGDDVAPGGRAVEAGAGAVFAVGVRARSTKRIAAAFTVRDDG